ncbi:hypothetical protein JDV09_16910 [Mycobacterium sp. Y57]|uniref:P27 family phage terminase small subunit n=1 Tax=Mycolicibacterium xanthum TaxID=2796469 RepID=UPI001C861681|nr:P27 family phage terminase small subunit [Mycolicibacterium xanthum]MBX7433776.1 hypothetical protein [Mycolicibacterium xanthum]
MTTSRKLCPEAQAIYDHHRERLRREGRLAGADLELLSIFADTMHLYGLLADDVQKRGVVVRSRQNWTKNPSLSPLAAARASLITLSRSIPLYEGKIDRTELDRQIDSILQSN